MKEGVVHSTTLMIPCPWALHAMRFLAGHPEIPFGVHLIVISDWVDYRWGPVTPREKVPSNDYDFLDSYSLDPVNKTARYAELLHELPVGLNEWAVHPGLDNSELLAIEPGGNHVRQTDFDFLMSQQAKDIIKAEGIMLLDYRALQVIWREK